jgi:WD40 repeat protein
MNLKFIITTILFLSLTSFFYSQTSEFSVQTGHSSEVNKLEFSKSGNIFASAGYDNNIVLWEFETGKQLRLITGHRGRINDLKFIHSDSVLISCSNDSTVRFWDTYTGELIQQTKTDFLPQSIAYNVSKNTLYIAAKVLYEYKCDTKEIEIYKTPKRKPFTRVHVCQNGDLLYGGDKLGVFYQEKNNITYKHRASLYDFAFSRNEESMYIATKGGNILGFTNGKHGFHYQKTLRSGYRFKSETQAIAVSDTNVLSLGRDNIVTLYHSKNGSIKKFYNTNYYDAKDIAVHPNGKVVITSANDGKIYLWDIKTGTLIRDFKSNSSAINFAKFSQDQKSIILGYNNGIIKFWDLTYGGSIRTHKFQLTSKQQKKGWRYHVLSMVSQNENVYTFKVVLTKPYTGIEYYKECRYYDFVWNLNTNQKTFTEKFVQNHEPNEYNFQSIVENSNRTFQNDTLFMIAEDTKITEYINDKPEDTGFKTPHTNPITSLDYDVKKKLYLTTSWDGQVLLYNQKGKVILRLASMGIDDFVMITPDDYYYATKGSLPYIGFTENHNAVSFQQYDLFYNRPDIVYSNTPYGNSEIVTKLEMLHQKRLSRNNILQDKIDIEYSAPNIKILAIEGPVSDKDVALVNIKIDDEYGIKNFQLKIDGVPIFESGKEHYLKNNVDTNITVQLQSGINKIDLVANNIKNIASITKTTYIKSNVKAVKPNLYFVGIGASVYQDTTKNLKYAKKDIENVNKTLKKSKMFKQTFSQTYFNKSVHKDSLNKIDDFLSQSTVNDVVIIYYAGHGLLNKNFDYYLATYNNDFYAPEENALPYSDLENKLLAIQSRKKLLFLDACHSGELDKESAVMQKTNIEEGKEIIFRNASNTGMKVSTDGSLDALKIVFADLKENNGITVISSAGGADYAIESDQWQNGAFTYCLVEGLKSGKSDLDQNGVITVSDLLQYLQTNVPILTNGYQIPTYRTENIENDFIIWKR